MRHGWVGLSLGTLAACSGSNGEQVAVSGSVGGFTPSFAQSVSAAWPLPSADGGTFNTFVVYLTSFVDGCAAVSTWAEHKSSTTLELYIEGTAPGTYPMVNQPGGGEAFFHAWDASCQDQLEAVIDGGLQNAASSGQVVLTRTSPTLVGTFDLSFPSGHLTGQFGALLCSQAANDAGGGACQ
jgi:hypothetical protein